MRSMRDDPTELEITVWCDGEVIARARNVLLARGAYEVAVSMYPKSEIQLCHRARVIEWHNRPAGS